MKSIKEFFAGKEKFELTNDVKPVMSKRVYITVQDMKSYNEYVKQGSLKFNRMTFYGKIYNGSFTAGEDRTHSEVDDEGKPVQPLVYRSVGRFELKLDTFEAQVTWAPPQGSGNRTWDIIGLAKCTNGLELVPEEANHLRIFYDNAIILRPWVQVAQNNFREHRRLKTLEFKTYMKYCSDDVTSQERRNVTAGIDYLFMQEKVRTALVHELGRQYQEVLLDVRDKIDPPKED